MKKTLLNIGIAFSLVFGSTANIFADVIEEVCTEPVYEDYYPVGDESGSTLYTKRIETVDCNITYELQGECKRWEEDEQLFGLDPDQYNTYRANDHSESLGGMFAGVSTYDQLEHLWSGWHGYCEIGTKHDFSWAEDPLFWASLAASAFMDSTGEGGLAEGALDSASAASQSALMSIIPGLSEIAAKCLVAAGLDLSFALAGSLLEEDEPPCDPVDEFCDEDVENAATEEVITMTVDEYDNLISEHPDAAEYMVIIPEQSEGNVVAVRFIQPQEIAGFEDMTEDAAKQMEDELAKMKLYIQAAITAGKLAMCGVTGETSTSVSTSSDDSTRLDLKTGVSTAISMIPAEWLGPFGGIIKAAAQVLLQIIFSFKDIDSCHDEEDAQEEGSRHWATYEALPYKLCHLSSKICAQEKIFFSGCALDGYNYCCYDQILTRILVEQLKAQLGRDWQHCTGISIRDLQFVSFRECDDIDKTYGFDGAAQVNRMDYPDEDDKIYDPEGAYQYVRKCINLDEFKEEIKNIFNDSIDTTDFYDTMDRYEDGAAD